MYGYYGKGIRGNACRHHDAIISSAPPWCKEDKSLVKHQQRSQLLQDVEKVGENACEAAFLVALISSDRLPTRLVPLLRMDFVSPIHNGRLLVSPGQTAYEVPSCSLLSVFCNFLCQTGESQSWLYWERSSGARHYPKSAGYNNNAQLLLVYGLRSDCEVKYLCNLHRRLIATAQGITSG